MTGWQGMRMTTGLRMLTVRLRQAATATSKLTSSRKEPGSPGNRGTVDIGSSNNSTNDIARQILYGISASDLAYHGGKLEFNSCGYLILNGDTGISAGVKDELAEIKGQPRCIPVFSQVNGPGNNADYKIVKCVWHPYYGRQAHGTDEQEACHDSGCSAGYTRRDSLAQPRYQFVRLFAPPFWFR